MILKRVPAGSSPATGELPLVLEKGDFGVFRPGYDEQVADGFRPRPDAAPVRLALPVDWDMDPFHDRNWRFQLHAWRMLEPIWNEFYGTDWDRLRAELLPWVADWHSYHVVRGRLTEFSWYDMAAGIRAQHLALLLKLHGDGLMMLEPLALAMVEQLAVLHVEKLREPGFIAMNNHGLFQLKGLRLLGVVLDGHPCCAGERGFSATLMRRLLEMQFDGFGMHVENSPDYHGFVLRQFAQIRPTLFPEIEEQLSGTLAKAAEILPWFTFPDRTIAPIGDSGGLGGPFGPGARPDFTMKTASGASFVVRDLTASGYAIVRSARTVPREEASMLVVKGQALSGTHAHADHLGFVLFAHGRHLLVDSGKYSYNRDEWRDYFTSDRAHNVVGLRGMVFGPQHTTTVGAGLHRLAMDGEQVIVEGEVARRGFFRHSRRITYRPTDRIEVLDHIQARPNDAPVAYWHLAPGIDAEKVRGGVELFCNGARLARISVRDAAVSARLVHGAQTPRIQGWVSASYKQKAKAVVIEYRAPAGCGEIATDIEIFKPVEVAPGALPRRLPRGLAFDFEYRFHSDRVGVFADGRTRRRITIQVTPEVADRAIGDLAGRLEAKGYRRLPSSTGSHDSTDFAHVDDTRASIALSRTRARDAVLLDFSWWRAAPKRNGTGDKSDR